MGNSKHFRFILGLTAVVTFATVVSFSFTNCSSHPQNAATPVTAFLSPEQSYEKLRQDFKGRVEANFCQSSLAYGCLKKVYSAEVENAELAPAQECASLQSGLQICPLVKTFQFNSQAAQENCKGCEESYEYQEYSCHLKIPNAENLYPIYFTEPSLAASLQKLSDFCASLTGDSP